MTIACLNILHLVTNPILTNSLVSLATAAHPCSGHQTESPLPEHSRSAMVHVMENKPAIESPYDIIIMHIHSFKAQICLDK